MKFDQILLKNDYIDINIGTIKDDIITHLFPLICNRVCQNFVSAQYLQNY